MKTKHVFPISVNPRITLIAPWLAFRHWWMFDWKGRGYEKLEWIFGGVLFKHILRRSFRGEFGSKWGAVAEASKALLWRKNKRYRPWSGQSLEKFKDKELLNLLRKLVWSFLVINSPSWLGKEFLEWTLRNENITRTQSGLIVAKLSTAATNSNFNVALPCFHDVLR